MSENVMLYANQAPGVIQAPRKLQPNVTYSTAELDTPEPERALQPLPSEHTTSRLKPKQPFLKRGTGLQSRLEATKHKRYKPKGGFVKGQNEAEQDTARLSSMQQPALAQHQQQPSDTAPLSYESDYGQQLQNDQSHLPPMTARHGLQPRSSQQWMPHQQQAARRAVTAPADHDLEAEMDADSALVHFPSRPGTQASRQPPHEQEQGQHNSFAAPQPMQHLHLPMRSEVSHKNFDSSAGISLDHLEATPANAALATDEWQLQQATEALELEEFQELERQIIKNAGTSMRSSMQSVPNAAVNRRVNRQKLAESSAQHTSAAQGVPHASQFNKQHSHPDLDVHNQQQYATATGLFLQESSYSAVQGLHAPLTAAAQMKRNVSGNPFAQPDDFWEDSGLLYSQPLSASMTPEQQHMQASQYVKGFPDPQAAQQIPKQTIHNIPETTDADDVWHSVASDAVAPTTSGRQKAGKDKAKPNYIQQMFKPEPAPQAQEPSVDPGADQEAHCIAALEQEMQGLQEERAKVTKLRAQLESATARMEQEQAAWAKRKEEEVAAWESEREAEVQRLKRHQRVLDKQSRALLKLPNRKERSEVEAVEAVLEQERKASNAKDARHKLTVERLRQKLVEVQDINAELREEIKFNEQRRLEEWNAKENRQPKADLNRPASTAKRHAVTKPDQKSSSKPAMTSQRAGMQQVAQPFLQTEAMPSAAVPSPQQTVSEFDNDESEEEDEGQFQQVSPAVDTIPVQLSYQASGPLAQQLSAQQSYAALHASYAQPVLQNQHRPVQAGMRYEQLGSMQQAQAGGNSILNPALAQAQEAPVHPVIADKYDDAVVRSSAGGFVWQPLHPAERHSISTTAPASSAMFQPLQASSSGIFYGELADDVAESHSPHLHTAHAVASGGRDSRQQAQEAQPVPGTQQWLSSSASQQGVHQDSTWASSTAPQRLNDSRGAFTAFTGRQQEWALMSNSSTANIDRIGATVTPAQDVASDIWAQNGDRFAASHVAYMPAACLSSSQKPEAPSAVGTALWQQADSQPVNGMQFADTKKAIVQNQAESAPVAVGQAGAAEMWDAALSSMQEVHHADGKVEQIFADGRRTVIFGNGTSKHQFPDGHTTIRFTNKDIKRFFPNGRVEYFYQEVDTWHTTHADGVEVFYFPNGQTEAHHPSGVKEIIFPDNVIRKVFPDGKEQDVTPDMLLPAVKLPVPEATD